MGNGRVPAGLGTRLWFIAYLWNPLLWRALNTVTEDSARLLVRPGKKCTFSHIERQNKYRHMGYILPARTLLSDLATPRSIQPGAATHTTTTGRPRPRPSTSRRSHHTASRPSAPGGPPRRNRRRTCAAGGARSAAGRCPRRSAARGTAGSRPCAGSLCPSLEPGGRG